MCLHGTTVALRAVCSVRHQLHCKSSKAVVWADCRSYHNCMDHRFCPAASRCSSSQTSPVFCVTRRFITVLKTAHHSSPSNFFKIHFNITHRHPDLSSDIFRCCVSIRAIWAFPLCATLTTCPPPAHLILFDVITLIMPGEQCRSSYSLLWSCFQLLSLHLLSKYLPPHLILGYLQTVCARSYTKFRTQIHTKQHAELSINYMVIFTF